MPLLPLALTSVQLFPRVGKNFQLLLSSSSTRYYHSFPPLSNNQWLFLSTASFPLCTSLLPTICFLSPQFDWTLSQVSKDYLPMLIYPVLVINPSCSSPESPFWSMESPIFTSSTHVCSYPLNYQIFLPFPSHTNTPLLLILDPVHVCLPLGHPVFDLSFTLLSPQHHSDTTVAKALFYLILRLS